MGTSARTDTCLRLRACCACVCIQASLRRESDERAAENAKLREEVGHAEAELVVTKQQLARFTEKEEDSYE